MMASVTFWNFILFLAANKVCHFPYKRSLFLFLFLILKRESEQNNFLLTVLISFDCSNPIVIRTCHFSFQLQNKWFSEIHEKNSVSLILIGFLTLYFSLHHRIGTSPKINSGVQETWLQIGSSFLRWRRKSQRLDF